LQKLVFYITFAFVVMIIALIISPLLPRHTIPHIHHNLVNDCVPATIHRIFPTRSEDELCDLLNTDTNGTAVSELLIHWKELTTNQLIVLYAVNEQSYRSLQEFPSVTIDKNFKLNINTPYLWFGEVCNPNDMNHHYYHCALLFFTETNIVLSNSQFYPNTTNYYNFEMNLTDVLKNTFLLMTSKDMDSGKIRLQ
jgi:hypothetical protein